jgi:hypothetical protein
MRFNQPVQEMKVNLTSVWLHSVLRSLLCRDVSFHKTSITDDIADFDFKCSINENKTKPQ